VLAILLVGIVLYSYIIIDMNFNNINKKHIRTKLSNFIESLNTKYFRSALQMFYFFLRRLVTAFILVFLNKYPSI
jgi:hypothetical protein